MTDTPARRHAEAAGRRAEIAAALFLRCKGYRILARRLRTPVGEIDLVIRRGGTVAFVEVKLRRGEAAALEAVTATARRRIAAAARWWLAANPEYVGYVLRFDLVACAPWSPPQHLAGAFDAGF